MRAIKIFSQAERVDGAHGFEFAVDGDLERADIEAFLAERRGGLGGAHEVMADDAKIIRPPRSRPPAQLDEVREQSRQRKPAVTNGKRGEPAHGLTRRIEPKRKSARAIQQFIQRLHFRRFIAPVERHELRVAVPGLLDRHTLHEARAGRMSQPAFAPAEVRIARALGDFLPQFIRRYPAQIAVGAANFGQRLKADHFESVRVAKKPTHDAGNFRQIFARDRDRGSHREPPPGLAACAANHFRKFFAQRIKLRLRADLRKMIAPTALRRINVKADLR